MAEGYLKKHLEFITQKAIEEMEEIFSKIEVSEEARPYMGGFPTFIVKSMHLPYFKEYLSRKDVITVYKTMTHEEQEKDILRVLAFYKEQRMENWRAYKERERIARVN